LTGILRLGSHPMALLETKPQTTTTSADHPVFVAGDGRRARRLRHAAVIVGVLAVLWIVGLGVGMLGFGSLPGVALVKGAHNDPPAAKAPQAQLAGQFDAKRLLASEVRLRQKAAGASLRARRSAARSSSGHPAVTRRTSHRPAAKPTTTATPTPVNPAQRTRGWARKGYSAPRGQLRKAAPPPPPATSRGPRVGQTTTPPAPVTPPGRAGKALEPPPPPPPSKKG
jgi:hypothetical protein